jgi:hypothetical protein
MATRFSVSLAHAGCDHTGLVIWEERERADARGPLVVGLPRGFVSLNSDDGSIEIVCAGCRQTVASAARGDAPGGGAPADQEVAKTEVATVDAASGEPRARGAAPDAVSAGHAVGETPVTPADAIAPANAAAPVDAASEDKVRADIEALFAQAEDVAPIRGDAIPQHLLDKLRHLADRMRQRRE